MRIVGWIWKLYRRLPFTPRWFHIRRRLAEIQRKPPRNRYSEFVYDADVLSQMKRQRQRKPLLFDEYTRRTREQPRSPGNRVGSK